MAGGSTRDLAGVGVLLVDDDPDTRELLAIMLGTCGATVRAVGSARGAVIACDELVPDVIVSDLGMADSDGYDLLRAVRTRSQCARVPIIAVTGYAGHRDGALAAGFSDFIVKPVEHRLLCRKLAHHVAASRL
jgi:CheY-like chemotaxis protein